MKNIVLVVAVILSALFVNKRVSIIDKYYYECFLFSSARDSSFLAYRMDFVIGNHSSGIQQVYSLRSTSNDTWIEPGYKEALKTEHTLQIRNHDGVFSEYVSVDTDTALLWRDPFNPLAHKYLGQVDVSCNGQVNLGYLFEEYYYLCTDDRTFVPTPFYIVFDDKMVLYYSKAPCVGKLNIPLGKGITFIENDFCIENWSYEFNPIVSYKRIKESEVPRTVKRAFDKTIRKSSSL